MMDYTSEERMRRFLPIIFILVVPISTWIFWNVKSGRYSNMDVSNRKQRKGLYFFIAGVIIIYFMFEYLKFGIVDLVVVFLMILLLMMQASNYFIKSSMHTAFNIFVAVLFFSQNIIMGIFWLGIAVLVGITRIILKRHTVKEVISGTLIALFVSFIYLYTHIQFEHHLN
jgi:membrane-associated phospholipid phosphatase